ncbi:MAG TPA: S41 family peptidase, partial [Rhodocyclaceae bacterium]|nr:S41 family peptidase [Rhodocyclaceae bacterium]
GYGYMRIAQFQEETAADVVKQVDKLYQQNKGNLRGLVLDLRNDPGGLLHGAVGVAAAFLPPKALIVSTDGRTEDSKRKFIASPEDYLSPGSEDFLKKLPAGIKTVPLVVLVNGGSASASEIVAGALQDHKRAVLLGTQTFGKASVQTILPLSNNTAIKLTTARYYTPNGRSIQVKGITPDVVVPETPDGGAQDQLREVDLEHHLQNDKDKTAAPKPQPKQSEPETKPVPFEYASKNDYQLNQALGLLKAWQIIKQQR